MFPLLRMSEPFTSFLLDVATVALHHLALDWRALLLVCANMVFADDVGV